MIDYGAKAGEPDWYMLFKVSGSVFPRCLSIVLPLSLLAVVLKVLHNEEVLVDITSMSFVTNTSPWGGFSGLVNFVIVFRLSTAFNTYWSAYSVTQAMLSDWSGAASSAVVFSRHTQNDAASHQTYLHTLVRLFSMLSACALQELSPRESHKIWGLLTLDAESLNAKSLASLDGSPMRVDLCYHWIQQLLVDNQASGMLAAPAPIVSRAFAELSAGMSKFCDAKKHATEQFTFAYAQATTWLLILYSVFMPMMMVQWSDWLIGAFAFTFVQLFFTWSLNFITIILERPFDSSNPNSIDVFRLQHAMNNALLLNLDPKTLAGPPTLEKTLASIDCSNSEYSSPGMDTQPWAKAVAADYLNLQRRDTIHKAALKKEGWHLKDEFSVPTSENLGDVVKLDARPKGRCCWCFGETPCCCTRIQGRPSEIAVSGHYCTKRFGVIDGRNTAVLPIGIFGDKMVGALPPMFGHRRAYERFRVKTIDGPTSEVIIKTFSIQDRHKLHTVHDWSLGDFHDFPYDYQDLVSDVYHARTNYATVPTCNVSTAEALAVETVIQEAKAADRERAGVHEMVNLKLHDVFCSQLMEKCGLEPWAAEWEWKKREALPNEWEHGLDNKGNKLIELDIEQFRKEQKRIRRLLQNALRAVQKGKESGAIVELEVAIKKAESDKMSLIMEVPEVELAILRKEIQLAKSVLDGWQEADKAMHNAAEERSMEKLREAIVAAHNVKLQSGNFRIAERILRDLQVQHNLRRTAQMQSGALGEGILVVDETSVPGQVPS